MGEDGPEGRALARASATPAEDPLAEFFYDPDEEVFDSSELARVAEGARALAEATAPERRVEFLAFRLGREDCALELGWVREIVKPPPIAVLPRVPPFVLGVIMLRGEAVPVFSLHRLLALPEDEEAIDPTEREVRLIVIELASGRAALLVDGVSQVLRLPAHTLEAPPRGLSRGAAAEYLHAIGRHQGRLYAILDPVALFPPGQP